MINITFWINNQATWTAVPVTWTANQVKSCEYLDALTECDSTETLEVVIPFDCAPTTLQSFWDESAVLSLEALQAHAELTLFLGASSMWPVLKEQVIPHVWADEWVLQPLTWSQLKILYHLWAKFQLVEFPDIVSGKLVWQSVQWLVEAQSELTSPMTLHILQLATGGLRHNPHVAQLCFVPLGLALKNTNAPLIRPVPLQFERLNSLDVWKTRFAEYTGGLFRDFDWTGVVVGGGAVHACLDAIADWTTDVFTKSDVDLFIAWGHVDTKQQLATAQRVLEYLVDSGGVLALQGSSVITATMPPGIRNVQVVLSAAHTLPNAILEFDLDFIKCFFDGHTVWATPGCVLDVASRVCVPVTHVRPVRVAKAVKKGFEVHGCAVPTEVQESPYHIRTVGESMETTMAALQALPGLRLITNDVSTVVNMLRHPSVGLRGANYEQTLDASIVRPAQLVYEPILRGMGNITNPVQFTLTAFVVKRRDDKVLLLIPEDNPLWQWWRTLQALTTVGENLPIHASHRTYQFQSKTFAMQFVKILPSTRIVQDGKELHEVPTMVSARATLVCGMGCRIQRRIINILHVIKLEILARQHCYHAQLALS